VKSTDTLPPARSERVGESKKRRVEESDEREGVFGKRPEPTKRLGVGNQFATSRRDDSGRGWGEHGPKNERKGGGLRFMGLTDREYEVQGVMKN